MGKVPMEKMLTGVLLQCILKVQCFEIFIPEYSHGNEVVKQTSKLEIYYFY